MVKGNEISVVITCTVVGKERREEKKDKTAAFPTAPTLLYFYFPSSVPPSFTVVTSHSCYSIS